MTVSTRHALYAVKLDPDAFSGTPVILGGIDSHKLLNGTEVISETTSAQLYPTHQHIASQKPTSMFTTKSVAAGLAACGLSGLAIAAASQTGLTFYAQKHQSGAARASGSAHRSFNIKKGLLIPKRLTCEHQKDAVLEFELYIIYDGTNNPIVIADSVALSGSVTDAERFTIGAVTLESIAFPQIHSFEIDFGITCETLGADSDIWDTHVSIVEVKPTITLKGIDVSWFRSNKIPLSGLACTHANTKLYLRKRSRTSASSFVADATTEHLKFTAEGLAHVEDAFDASAQSPAETNLVLPCRYDGTNAPLVISTASAIT